MNIQTQGKTMNEKPIPEGYRRNARGSLDPIETIRPIDLQRDELVQELVARAKALSGDVANFREAALADIAAFVQLSGEQYGVQLGGNKGNVSLTSYDGRYKVLRAIAENLSFDERLQAAKALIEECLTEWTQGARPELRAIVNRAFETDKAGNLNTNAVLGLRRLDINDDRWHRAMQAIGESLQVVGSKSYIRLYERVGDSDKYALISLDVAA